MFCMKCVLCINISRPEAKEYGYITYWLILSRIANCFELTATLSYALLEDSNQKSGEGTAKKTTNLNIQSCLGLQHGKYIIV